MQDGDVMHLDLLYSHKKNVVKHTYVIGQGEVSVSSNKSSSKHFERKPKKNIIVTIIIGKY